MFAKFKKNVADLGVLVKDTYNMPVPLGKTVLITAAIAVASVMITHKIKIVLVFS